MKTITARELMVPIEEYATVTQNADLHEAIIALEKAQKTLEPSQHQHRAILVLDGDENVLGKLTMKDILRALEPNYRNLEGMDVLSRSGHSPDLIKSMLENNALWLEPLEFVCQRATQLKVSDFVEPPDECEYVDENATLGETIHQLLACPYQSLLATRDKKVVGILRLSDVFSIVCDKIKTCRI
ncbi:MAG: CBS domain-containing protein [Deltaproteobacteria bacterium]|nr:CBS domain-containing protein [Deltaproteobacteria bacterium]MBW2369860.1 CBS domain-containing protein [Deltaproteobacteria bacterium]